MDNFSDSKKLVSVYNEAQLQIMRLGNRWEACHRYCMNGDFQSYKNELDRAWIELSADAKKLNEKFYYGAIAEINNAISRANNRTSLYYLLQKKEIFLRNLQETAGKGSKRKQEGGTWF